MGTANQIEQELMNYISDHKIRNTHSHHLPEQAMVDFDLDKLINNTYLQWQQVTPGTTAESRNAYLEKTRYKSYFVWLQKAIGELYGISEPITAQNWDQISDRIRKAHQNPDFYMDVLKNKCKYQKVIVDTYWNPGSDNGRPELFTPAFRLDLFFLGYKKDFAIMTVHHWKRTSVSCRTIYRIMWSGSESGSYKKRVRAVWP